MSFLAFILDHHRTNTKHELTISEKYIFRYIWQHTKHVNNRTVKRYMQKAHAIHTLTMNSSTTNSNENKNLLKKYKLKKKFAKKKVKEKKHH